MRLDLPRPGVSISRGSSDAGRLPMHVGEVAEAGAGLAVGGQADPLGHVVQGDRRTAEHRAAGRVEVPRDGVQGVEQERNQGAEAAQAGAGAPVRGGASARGEGACQLASALGRHAGTGLGLLGRVGGRQALELGGALGVLGQPSAVDQALVEEHLQQGQQQPSVGVGADREVLELLRGLRPPRVDHHHPAAAHLQAQQLLAHPRRGEHRAVRDQWVGAHHEQEVGAPEVGDGHHQRRAVQQRAGGEPVVHVLRAGAVVVRRADRVEEALGPQRVRVGEGAGVAHVPGDRLLAVLVEDIGQAVGDVGERRLPRDLLERAVALAAQRPEHPVGVVDDLLHRDALGTRVAAGERMVGVGAQLGQLPVLDRGDHPAERLADTAEGDLLLDGHRQGEGNPPAVSA